MPNALAAVAHLCRTTPKCRTNHSCGSLKNAGPWAVIVVAAEIANRRLRAAPGRRITALSPEELTQGFLLHEEQLALLQHQVSIVFKFPEDAPMARSLMNAVREWQAEHKAGTAHPWGSCAHYTAAALLKELAKIEDPPKNFSTADNRHLQKVVKELGPDPHESLVHMVSYCSARLSAKKEHVILDFRPVLNTTLARHSELISGLLDGCEGERLGKRAPGSLVRKARGKPSDR